MAWLPKKCVVVPIDFSEQSRKGLETARELVDEIGHLHAIHVLPKIPVAEPGVVWTSIDDEARAQHAKMAFREGFAAGPFCKADFHVRIGDAGSEIAKFAEQLQADLIVMPSHGRSGVGRLLIGSVAERVLRLAHCPVLVLRGLSRLHD
jgi:nucleotide-binding universal stress UspA family protein